MEGALKENAPLCIIGYNPASTSKPQKVRTTPPITCDYAHRSYRLAKSLRAIWGLDSPRFLSFCTGLNTIFFRSPTANVLSKLQLKLDEFCEPYREELLRQLCPQRLLIIGDNAAKLLRYQKTTVLTTKLDKVTGQASGSNKVILSQGTIPVLESTPAYAVKHLSTYRFNRQELAAFQGQLRNAIAPKQVVPAYAQPLF